MVRALPLTPGGRRPPGVTLLEILVAVAVLAVGLATIFQVFPMGFAASAKGSAQTTAYELAARKLEDVRNNYLFGGIPGDYCDYYKYWGKRDAPNPDGATYARVNTAEQYRTFGTSAPECNYFYRVDCVPVLDPGRKYLEVPFSTDAGTTWRGFATLYRITVTVRGPLRTIAEAQDAQWGTNLSLQKGAIEVRLVTYVGNKALGDCLLTTDPAVDDPGSTGMKFCRSDAGPLDVYKPDSLLVKGLYDTDAYPYPYLENFTVFNGVTLSYTEDKDTGPAVYTADGVAALNRWTNLPTTYNYSNFSRYPMQGTGENVYGLDNVLIFCPTSAGTSATSFVAESNKIVGIYPPSVSPNTSTKYWRIDLLHRLYCGDGDNSVRTTGRLMDGTWNTVTGSTYFKNTATGSNRYGYPVGTSASKAWSGGTRVRFLMTLERRS